MQEDESDPLHEVSNPHRNLSTKEVALALKAASGSILKAAEALSVPVSKLSRFIHARPKFQELMVEMRKTIVDVAESHFMDKVLEGDKWAVNLALTTLGKDRGYGAKEVNVNLNKTTDPSKMSDAELALEVQKRVAAIKLSTKPPQIAQKDAETE